MTIQNEKLQKKVWTEHPDQTHQVLIRKILNRDTEHGLPGFAQVDPMNLSALAAELNLADPDKQLLPVPIKSIHIGSGGIHTLPNLVSTLTSGTRILLVTDSVNILCKTESVKEKIHQLLKAHFPTKWLVLSEKNGGDLHASDEHAKTIAQALTDIDCVVGVGGGTIADLCKYALHTSNVAVPLVLVQTMLSVNAFTDGLSVILKNGVKRTVQSRYPSAVIIDMDVVQQAPFDRTLSGYGDLMATWTAPADWLLADTLGMCTKYHHAPYQLLRFQSLELLLYSGDLRAKTGKAFLKLAQVLTLSGIAMGLTGESSPVSGSEHTISHLLDMAAESQGQALAYHGAQVGVSTLFMACVWDEFLRTFDPASLDFETCFPDGAFMEGHIQRVFKGLDPKGKLEQECWQDYRKKLELWHTKKEKTHRIFENWSDAKTELQKKVLPPNLLVECMLQAGAPTRFCELNPAVDTQKALWAIKNCHLYRSRFTLVDLLFFAGIWNDVFIEHILTRLERLGAGL